MKPHIKPCPCAVCKMARKKVIDDVRDMVEKGYEARTILESLEASYKTEEVLSRT